MRPFYRPSGRGRIRARRGTLVVPSAPNPPPALISLNGTTISIAAGALDGPTGLQTACHWYMSESGDYYRIADDLPQFPTEG